MKFRIVEAPDGFHIQVKRFIFGWCTLCDDIRGYYIFSTRIQAEDIVKQSQKQSKVIKEFEL
jgi:hypothetical protein